MNKLEIFKNESFGEIRTMVENGEVLFCATDIAKALGYSNPRDAIKLHCKRGTSHFTTHPQSPGKSIEMKFIPESDIYRLIIKSKLPQAEQFEQWVFEEVLPSIRKTGSYTEKKPVNRGDYSTPQNPIDEIYTYRGKPMWTIDQIATMFGCTRSPIKKRIDKFCDYGREYIKLTDYRLMDFKRENGITASGNNLIIVSERGLDTLRASRHSKGKMKKVKEIEPVQEKKEVVTDKTIQKFSNTPFVLVSLEDLQKLSGMDIQTLMLSNR